MLLRLRLAAGALALPVIGDEEADKLNNLFGDRSRNQGLNRCVVRMATAKRVDLLRLICATENYPSVPVD